MTLPGGPLGRLKPQAHHMQDLHKAFHIAGDYRVGIKESEHEAMFLTNVDGTTLVLDAAATSGARRIVYVSTVGVFGNTHGKIVDETYVRPDRDFLSYYDATKYMAHRIAKGRAADLTEDENREDALEMAKMLKGVADLPVLTSDHGVLDVVMVARAQPIKRFGTPAPKGWVFSLCARTAPEPGTTIARTPGHTRRPRTTAATARRLAWSNTTPLGTPVDPLVHTMVTGSWASRVHAPGPS